MWFFSYLKRRRNNRRFCAAVVVLLGHYMFERLPPAEQARVDEEINRNLRGDVEIVPATFWKQASWTGLAVERATAMARLGIEPTAYGLNWNLLLRRWESYCEAEVRNGLFYWPRKPLPWDARANLIWSSFHPFNDATRAAKDFLRERGLEVADTDPWGTGNLDVGDQAGFFDKTGLRRHWQRGI